MHKKNLILLTIVGIIAIVVPLTVFIAQKQQEIRQRAATSTPKITPPSLYFAMKENIVGINRLSLQPNESVTVSLRLNTNGYDINGFDITLKATSQPQNALIITKSEPGKDAGQFDTEIFNAINGSDNSLNFTRVSSDTTKSTLKQNLGLLNITLDAKSAGNGTIEVLKADLTSPENQERFLVLSTPLAYLPFDIQGPTSPPLPTPTSTPTSTPTPTPPLPGSTVLNLSLTLEGVGANRTLPSNIAVSPVTIDVFNINNDKTVVLPKTDKVVYQSKNGKFERQVDLGNKLPQGEYTIKIKIDNFLKKQVDDVFKVQSTTTTQTIPVSTTPLNPLLAGDVNNDGTINSLDYNAVLNCFGAKKNTSTCTDESSDINFDGAIDGIDHNITIRNFNKTDD